MWELNDLMTGVSYCNRNEWEQARIIGYLCMVPHIKKTDMKKILPFKWDEDHTTAPKTISKEEVKKLRDKSSFFEKIINKQNGR